MKPWTRLLVAIAIAGCGDDEVFTVEQLQDPSTCMECHPKHYEQWSGSMHAYASDDPVFVAMNNRGQRETNGQLGTFCVSCHAPMAVALGISDGQNFDPEALPAQARGVTCYFCHNVAEVVDDHNNGLRVALDQTMRGGVKNPVGNSAHRSKYDPLMDSDTNESEMCGSCHDIVNDKGVNVERTFAEWQTTFFATEKDPGIHLTCGSCHMQSSTDVIADAPGLDVPSRNFGFHEHMWPAIDQALTPFPQMAEQAAAIERDLDPSIAVIGTRPLAGGAPAGGICVEPLDGGRITVRIDSIGTGHAWPSGAALDRRTWLEVIAYDASNNILFQTGVVPDGVDPEAIGDPHLVGFWDRVFKEDNTKAHFFWEVARIDPLQPNGLPSLLPAPTTLDPNDPAFDHSVTAKFPIPGLQNQVERITTRVRFRPLPFELLDLLVESGDLDPAIRDRVVTYDVGGTQKTWERATMKPETGCSR